MIQPRFSLIGFLLFTVFGIPAATPQTSPGKTVWTGVYTASQANRGKAGYLAKCGACHGADLSGYQAVLTGRFMERWGEDHLVSFYTVVKTTMPRGAPDSLAEETYVDIVAFILQANGFPPGADELTVAALPGVRVEGKSGPSPLQTGALARTIGCLTQRDDKSWALVRATNPIRTRNPKSSTDEELKVEQGIPLGSQTFGLMDLYAYRPENLKGQKVEAKGFLIRNPAGDRINLSALQTTGVSCEP